MAAESIQAPVEWAQRKDVVFMTVAVENCKEPQVDVTDDKLHFKGKGGPDQRDFECTVEFFSPIDSSKVRRNQSDRNIQFVLPKKEPGPFWPRLMKSEKKVHWCKVDFNKWKDEDDLSDDETNFDFNDMMGQMGGLNAEKPDLDDLGDSDNEELPDLEDGEDESKAKQNEGDKQAGDGPAEKTTESPVSA